MAWWRCSSSAPASPAPPWATAAGGLATAVLVYLLAQRNGLDGLRLVLIGVGLGSLLLSFNSMLIVQADIYDAQEAGSWLVGNLAGAQRGQVARSAAMVGAVALCAIALSRPLTIAELSDDTSRGLGQRTDRVRLRRRHRRRAA